MKKKWIIVNAVLALLSFGAFCEIQIVYDGGGRLIAWRVLLPWSNQTVDRNPTFDWFQSQSGTNAVCTACDAKCYGLVGRGRVLLR